MEIKENSCTGLEKLVRNYLQRNVNSAVIKSYIIIIIIIIIIMIIIIKVFIRGFNQTLKLTSSIINEDTTV